MLAIGALLVRFFVLYTLINLPTRKSLTAMSIINESLNNLSATEDDGVQVGAEFPSINVNTSDGRTLSFPGERGYLKSLNLWMREGITESAYNTQVYFAPKGSITSQWNDFYQMLFVGYQDDNDTL